MEDRYGTDTVLLAARADRWHGERDDLIDFVRSFGTLAPRSCGSIHIEDDEAIPQARNDACQVYGPERGALTLEVDPRFTPFRVGGAESAAACQSITAALRMHTIVAWAGVAPALRMTWGRSQR